MKRLLLVDDCIDVHLLVRAKLRRAGRSDVELVTATDGQAALDYAQPERFPDLVITDVNMPRCDGPTLVGALRAAGYPGPILLTSSAPAALVAGAQAMIDKGILLDELAVLLDAWLGPAVS
ncbi:MAG: response regulator [Myxococcales bacterium]|nr:response regulator [Myxococcales bacterium]MCB9522821.1 response regulator [Myxococcales bacterium]